MIFIEFPDEDEPFYQWKERWAKENNIVIISNICIINSYISMNDAITLSYSLN